MQGKTTGICAPFKTRAAANFDPQSVCGAFFISIIKGE